MNDTERYFFCCRENLKSNHIFNLKIKFTLKKKWMDAPNLRFAF